MNNQIISREEATNKGLSYYFTGKLCKRGHLSHRYLSGVCASCSKENSQNYRKSYPGRKSIQNKIYADTHRFVINAKKLETTSRKTSSYP